MLAVIQTPVQDHQLKLMCKIQGENHNNKIANVANVVIETKQSIT